MIIYSIIALVLDEDWLYGISVIINLIWLVTAIPLFQKGINEKDWNQLKTNLLRIVGLVTIPSGLYEFITNKNIISSSYGISDNTFYLRGFHLDKLEFASYLCLGFFIVLSDILMGKKIQSVGNRIFKWYIIVLSFILIAFSFSTTSILGLIIGSLVMLWYVKGKLYPIIIFITISFGAIYIYQSSYFKNLNVAYDLKYAQNVDNLESSNFRYLALKASAEKIIEKPIFGHGMGNSGNLMKEALHLKKPINPHNLFANELLDYGLIPFVVLFSIIVRVLYFAFFKVKSGKDYLYTQNISLVVKAFSILIAFRLFFYYHRFDQTMYLLWISLAILGYISNRINNHLLKKH